MKFAPVFGRDSTVVFRGKLDRDVMAREQRATDWRSECGNGRRIIKFQGRWRIARCVQFMAMGDERVASSGFMAVIRILMDADKACVACPGTAR